MKVIKGLIKETVERNLWNKHDDNKSIKYFLKKKKKFKFVQNQNEKGRKSFLNE